MSLSHIPYKNTLPDIPNRPYTTDYSPHILRKESNSASFSESLPNNLPKPFVKEPGSPLRKQDNLLEDNPDYLDFLALQKEMSNYRIQVKGASVNRMPAELGNSHINGSSHCLLGADLHSKATKEFEMEFEISSPTSATSLKHVKSEMLSPENSVLSGGLSSFLHNSEKGSPHSSMKSFDHFKDKSDGETKIPWDDVSHLKSSTHLSARSNGRKRWAKLSCVMHSLSLFRRPEASMVQSSKAIGKQIENFSSPKLGVKVSKEQQILKKENFTAEAFDLFRRVQMFCNYAAIGSPGHIREMTKMLDRDPKRFILEPNDSQHLVNSKKGGCTPLYIAAKNGNLGVVKLLIERKANYWLKSKPGHNTLIEEIPLHAAAKWGHSNVVEYLIKTQEHDKDIINSCLKVASNSVVRELLRHEFEQKGGSKSFLRTICRCWGN